MFFTLISVDLEGVGRKCPPPTTRDAFERIRLVGLNFEDFYLKTGHARQTALFKSQNTTISFSQRHIKDCELYEGFVKQTADLI